MEILNEILATTILVVVFIGAAHLLEKIYRRVKRFSARSDEVTRNPDKPNARIENTQHK